MKRIGNLFLILVFLFTPFSYAFGACRADGQTVVYVNGILTSIDDAKKDLGVLEDKFEKKFGKNTGTHFINGYNPSHLAGAGDVAQTVAQIFGTSISDYDLDTILLQIQPEVTTRKVLLLGHSQGTFYTNAMYDYLLSHGEPREAVGVYNIATPASTVAGGGAYLTANQDSAIALVAQAAAEVHGPAPLPPNVDMELTAADFRNPFPGHLLADAYLADVPERVVSDMSTALARLQPTYASDTGDCFDAPDLTLGYHAQQLLFAVADPVTQAGVTGTVLGAEGVAAVGSVVFGAIHAGVAAVASIFNSAAQVASSPQVNPAAPENRDKNFTIVKKLYGSSVDAHDVDDINGPPTSNQGAAVALTFGSAPVAPTSTVPLGRVLGTTSAATSTPLATSTPPVVASASVGGGGGFATPPDTTLHASTDSTVVDDATTTASTTPDVVPAEPTFFTASSTPPVVSINECAYSLNTSVCLLATSSVTLVWGAVPGAVGYQVLVDETPLATTTALAMVVPAADMASTTFSVVAYDSASSTLASDEVSVFAARTPVVINEIGWAGTNASVDDQWIEVKDTTPYWIDWTHVAIVARDGGSQYIPLAALNTFYQPPLLLTTPPSYAPVAFARVDGTFGARFHSVIPFDTLAPTGEQLALVWETPVGTTTIDQTPPISACNGWCAGAIASTTGYFFYPYTTPDKQWMPQIDNVSMERLSDADGTLATSWVNPDDYYRSGMTDRNGNPVYGTPNSTNSRHAPAFGMSCIHESGPLVPGGTYSTPPYLECTFYSGFIMRDVRRGAGIFDGEVGSSTTLYTFDLRNGLASDQYILPRMYQPIPAGEHLFLAIWQDTFSPDWYDFSGYVTGYGQNTPPTQNYRILPFIWGGEQ